MVLTLVILSFLFIYGEKMVDKEQQILEMYELN